MLPVQPTCKLARLTICLVTPMHFHRFEVVLTCWDSYADKRPTFTDLVLSITMLLEGISGYMDFSAVSGAGGEALPGYDSLEPKTNLSGATYDHLQTEETPNH